MSINELTKEELLNVRSREWGEDIGEFDELIIVPLDTIHDSGYKHIEYIAIKDGVPLCRLGANSDVIHIGGFSGALLVGSSRWSMDCLPRSGLLRLFNHGKRIKVGLDLSDFEVFEII